MTGVARGTLVDVSWPVTVYIVHLRLPVLVAVEARELAEVVGVDVTVLATGPASLVLAGEDREVEAVVVCEICICPGDVRVTKNTGRWEAGAGVNAVIVTLVARNTVRWLRGVRTTSVVRMTALARQLLMCTTEWKTRAGVQIEAVYDREEGCIVARLAVG